MRIAIIGLGHIGGALGTKWAAAGHDVVYGSRTPGEDGPGGVPTKELGEAIDKAEVVAFAIPGAAVDAVLAEHGPALAGKLIIDPANRSGKPSFNSHEPIKAAAPKALYARAFNTLGFENFVKPPAGGDLFFAADAEAREQVEQLITDVGLRPVYVGGADSAATVDALLPLWISVVKTHGGNRHLAFKLLD